MAFIFAGKKEGMTQIFDEKGNAIVCTVISTEPHVVVQVKNQEKDGYEAVQLGAVKQKKLKLVSNPLKGHFSKSSIEPRRYLVESRLESSSEFQVGQEIQVVEALSKGDFVDITGTSKGKGFQGVIKLHNFSGGPAAHGSGFHRHAGSTGMRTTPGRCIPGGKRASRMGGEKVTVQNLEVVAVQKEQQLILIRGAIPGCCGSLVYVTAAKKMKKKK